MIRTIKRLAARGGAFALGAALLIAPLAVPGQAAHAADGQSPDPAPLSIQRTALTSGHSDTVSAFFDNGELELGSKADLDGKAGVRIDSDRTVFHLGDGSRVKKTDQMPEFLGSYDAQLWLATQTQTQGTLWPGFSTENEALVKASSNGKLDLQLVDVKGPGRVEIFTTGGLSGANRMFSSVDKLPAWQMSMRQHSHAFWAFSKPGRYELTFRGTTQVGGQTVTDEQTYTFHIGSIDSLTSSTSLSLKTSATEVDPQAPLELTAELSPTNARGAVEFTDIESGLVLGHAPVRDGTASFTATSLTSGQHRIVAKFVPTYADEFASVSIADTDAIKVTVTGEAIPRPQHDDTNPIGTLTGEASAGFDAPELVQAGEPAIAVVRSSAFNGHWVSIWWYSDAGQQWAGWRQVDATGRVSAVAPAGAGDYRLVASTGGADGAAPELIGWDDIRVDGADDTGIVLPGETGSNPTNPSNNTGSAGSSNGGKKKPSERGQNGGQNGGQPGANANAGKPGAETAGADSCEPGMVLDHGHVDAFNVSASGSAAVLQLKEDVTGSHVIHEAEDVLLRVKPEARKDIPSGYPGAPGGYVLPLTQDANLLWPGWDTNGTTSSGFTNTRIHINSVDGPGTVHLYSLGDFGGAKSVLEGDSTQLPGTILVSSPAHTHAQWVFSQEGIYKLRVSATVKDPKTGKEMETAEHTYVFQVGDVELGNAFCDVAVSADAAAAGEAVQAAVAKADKAAAEDAAKKEEANKKKPKANQTTASADGGAEGTTAAASTETVTRAAVIGAAIGTAGTSALAGLGGLVTWYVRRMRRLGEAAEAASLID